MKNMLRLSRITPAGPRRRRVAWVCVLAGVATTATGFGAALMNGFAQSPPTQNASAPPQAVAALPNAKPGTAPAAAPSQKVAQAAIDPQKQQLASECAQLLKMATALKTEVDKTTKDTLSIPVVREAGEIEQLAHRARAGTGKS